MPHRISSLLVSPLVFRSPGCSFCFFTAALILSFCTAAPAQDDEVVLPDLLGGWQAADEAQVFIGNDLFLYINGGAEIYREYGFERVSVRAYARGEEMISIEIYRMTSDAFGIYSFTRAEEGEALALGTAGTLADYYLSFWSGPHLVVVAAQSLFEGSREAVLEVGRGLAAQLPAAGEEPDLMALLPEERRMPGSERYVAGPIALQNASYLASRMFSGYVDGAVANYQLGETSKAVFLVLRWTDAEAARKAMREAEGKARADARAKFERRGEGGFELIFDDGRRLRVAASGAIARVVVARGEIDLSQLFEGEEQE